MANRFWKRDFQSLITSLTCICGSFGTNGTSAPINVRGKGFTVARTGVGVYVVTLADQYAKLFSATGTIQLASFGASAVKIGPYSATSKTLTVWTDTSGVLADIAADANNRVSFTLMLTTSGVD